MEFSNQLGGIGWMLLFGAAIYLITSQRANNFVVIGLFGLGLGGFITFLASLNLMPMEVFEAYLALRSFIYLAAIGFLIFGILNLTRGSAGGGNMFGRSNTMQDSAGVNLSTLFIPRNDTNTFSKGQKLRDEACDRFLARAKAHDLKVIEQRSQAHSPGVWFRLDYLSPSPASDLSLTMSVAVDIERFDFHKYENLFNVTIQVGAAVHKFTGVMDLDDSTVDHIYHFMMTPGAKLKLRNRVREFPWQLWRPKNKVARLKPDWLSIGLTVAAIAVFFIPIIGIIAAAGIVIYLYWRKRQRRTYVLTSGKPKTDPRTLRWMDSWQGSIPELGPFDLTVKKGIIERLLRSQPEGAKVEIERIGYWGTDSWVERDQVVVMHRRAIGFIHIEPYAEALFVAWESHLNSASWVEETLSTGIDAESGLDVVANRVVAGQHLANEYDVSDSNFLAEWIHDAVKQELQLRMAEQKIDQEIDFTIQRESRSDALSKSSAAKNTKKKDKTSRFKRVA